MEELAQAADRLFYAMRRSRAATVGRSSAGLSRAQLALLAPLAEDSARQGLPVGKLAAHAEVSVPTATRMLNHLEADGVIIRARAEDDERRVLIRPTDDGTHRLVTMRSELRARQERALSRYTTEERRALAVQLRQLADVITDMMTDSDH